MSVRISETCLDEDACTGSARGRRDTSRAVRPEARGEDTRKHEARAHDRRHREPIAPRLLVIERGLQRVAFLRAPAIGRARIVGLAREVVSKTRARTCCLREGNGSDAECDHARAEQRPHDDLLLGRPRTFHVLADRICTGRAHADKDRQREGEKVADILHDLRSRLPPSRVLAVHRDQVGATPVRSAGRGIPARFRAFMSTESAGLPLRADAGSVRRDDLAII
jgi:hypothetical protein